MLRQANCIKHITASGGGDLEAGPGRSLLVKRIEVVPSSNDTYLKMLVDRKTVGYYRLAGKSGNHLGCQNNTHIYANLMQCLADMGHNVFIPVAEGQKFTVSRYAEAGNVIIIYDEYDAADITAAMPNGSESNDYTFIQYMNVGTAITATGDATVDVSLSPAEFPAFPCGKEVPSKHSIEILGLVGCPWCDGAAGPVYFVTDKIKLIKDRNVLLDEDRNGIPFKGDTAPGTGTEYGAAYSLIGPCTPIKLDSLTTGLGKPLMFDPPLAFDEGDELNVLISCTKSGAATWTANLCDLAAIMKVHRK